MTDPRAPHLLYVAWGYPPSRGGGVYRALATPNLFARAGWRVTVLTVTRETFEFSTGIDASLEERIDSSIRVERIPFDVPRYQLDLRRWSRWRAAFPELWNTWVVWRDRRGFPEPTYGAWEDDLRAAARRLHADEPVDLVIATANPNVDFAAADELGALGVPYVLDYRDAWQLDVFTGRRLAPRGGRVDVLETRLIDRAREIWFVNEPIRRWHQAEHPAAAERMHVVANGFDAELADFSPTVRPDRNAGITMGYIGTISARVPLEELLAGWRIARAKDPLLATSELALHGYLDYFGAPNERWLAVLDRYRDDGVSFRGPVAKAAIAETYAGFDALVLALGTGVYVTSGKVFEYCATGLPVVSVHDPGNAASDVLREHPSWFPVDSLDPERIAEALIAGAHASAAQTAQDRLAVQRWAAGYERAAQLTPRIAALTSTATIGDAA